MRSGNRNCDIPFPLPLGGGPSSEPQCASTCLLAGETFSSVFASVYQLHKHIFMSTHIRQLRKHQPRLTRRAPEGLSDSTTESCARIPHIRAQGSHRVQLFCSPPCKRKRPSGLPSFPELRTWSSKGRKWPWFDAAIRAPALPCPPYLAFAGCTGRSHHRPDGAAKPCDPVAI